MTGLADAERFDGRRRRQRLRAAHDDGQGWMRQRDATGRRVGAHTQLVARLLAAPQAVERGHAARLRLHAQRRMAAFYRMWSSKEARYKLGVGSDAAASCIALAHPALSIVVCSAQPLAAAPAIEAFSIG